MFNLHNFLNFLHRVQVFHTFEYKKMSSKLTNNLLLILKQRKFLLRRGENTANYDVILGK